MDFFVANQGNQIMAIPKPTDEDIKLWWDEVQNYRNSKLSLTAYAKKNNLAYTTFVGWVYRFDPWTGKYKNDKERELELVELYLATNAPREQFSLKHGIHKDRLTTLVVHLGYMERLKNYLAGQNEQEQKTMKFTEIKPEQPIIKRTFIEHEVITPKNDLELIIKKGVKVTIAPEISNEQLITIIEFLRNL